MASIEEQRVHVRVTALLPCRISAASGEHYGKIVDVSRGGARVEVPKGSTNLGEVLSLSMVIPTVDSPIEVMAEVLRRDEQAECDCLGIRFAAIEPALSQALTQFIASIDGRSAGGARRHPRYMRRLEISLTTVAEFRAVMRDVSRGGFGLTCDVPVVLDEAVKVAVQVPGFPPLVLPAKVVHVRSGRPGTYRVGVGFDELNEGTQHLLTAFIRSLGNRAEK